MVDRPRARAGAWYEMVPRSQGRTPGQHGTFRDCIARLPDIAAMGFDVLYLTPIHPIGRSQPQGPQQRARLPRPAIRAARGPSASAEGGHDAMHPELGTLDGFPTLRGARVPHGHRDRARHRDAVLARSPLGAASTRTGSAAGRTARCSIAENPPKKYEDIVNPSISHRERRRALWHALRDVVLFWVGSRACSIFRVDNPHTKPFRVLGMADRRGAVAATRTCIFLAEAFTRPKVMNGLAKLGFTQSYTYFTWRNAEAGDRPNT
ncbi:MAG: hypothetical protein MZV49_21650 [Rhodopseudomonas palustris]|nr:hypothetical protein [Rhodopseudomonas palustris]